MKLKIPQEWLAEKAEQEGNGIVSVGGLVTLIERETVADDDLPFAEEITSCETCSDKGWVDDKTDDGPMGCPDCDIDTPEPRTSRGLNIWDPPNPWEEALKKAQQKVKPIIDQEREGERITSELLNFRMGATAMAVRAKVRCNAKYDGEVHFTTVYEPDEARDAENARFTTATPWGDIRMGINNPVALEQFEVNKEYYVDFTPAAK